MWESMGRLGTRVSVVRGKNSHLLERMVRLWALAEDGAGALLNNWGLSVEARGSVCIGVCAEWREVEGSNDPVAPVTISDTESQLATCGYQNRIQTKLFFDKSTLFPMAKCWTVPYYESPRL
jgi:hypothetical protein